MEEGKKEGEGWENIDQALSSRELGGCIALFVMKGQLWCISRRDRVSSPKGICRTDGWAFSLPKSRDIGFP